MATRDLWLRAVSLPMLTASAAMPACADEATTAVDDEMSAQLDGDCPRELDYQKVAKPFLAKYCLRCHSEQLTRGSAIAVAHVFDTEADVRGAGQHVYDTVALETMPPSFGPPDLLRPARDERDALLAWLVCSNVAEELEVER